MADIVRCSADIRMSIRMSLRMLTTVLGMRHVPTRKPQHDDIGRSITFRLREQSHEIEIVEKNEMAGLDSQSKAFDIVSHW